MACTCKRCKREYKIDIIVNDNIWDKINPNSNGGGLLCPRCIVALIDDHYDYLVLNLTPIYERLV